jgi:hypothetical protein
MCRTPVTNEYLASEDAFFGYMDQQQTAISENSEKQEPTREQKLFAICFDFQGSGYLEGI